MRTALVTAIIGLVASTIARADQWPTPPVSRTTVAIDGSVKVVEYSPGRNFQRSITVYATSELNKRLWEADLLNCPVQIFVSPGGATVVTMDRWGSLGSDAIVFYGPRGTVLARYENAEESLLTKRESSKIQRTVSSFPWDEGSHAGFTADGAYFWVWLAWGRVLIFDAKTGKPLDAAAFRIDVGRGRPVMMETLELMSRSATPSDRIAAARLAGWLNGQAVLPVLNRLQADIYYEETGQQTKIEDPWERFGENLFFLYRRLYPVRRAAAEELHIHFGQAGGGVGVEDLVAR